MSSDIIYTDATKLAELIRTREISPVEVVQAHLDRTEAVNPKLNAIVTVADNALKAAKAAESAVLAGAELGPLHGVPFTAKDSIDTAGVLTQRGSPIFKGRWDGLPIGVQLVSNWLAESTVLHLASLLETASSVRNLHPKI